MTSGKINRKGRIRSRIRRAQKAAMDLLMPMLQRPMQLQIAALCHRMVDGKVQVLLITSRGTGRWIIPKGWLMRGKNASEAAVVEAWEEAGVRPARVAETPFGSYVYDKIKRSGLPVAVETLVFPVEVRMLEDDYPERDQRRRQWIDPAEAAELVDEPGLKQILLDFGAGSGK